MDVAVVGNLGLTTLEQCLTRTNRKFRKFDFEAVVRRFFTTDTYAIEKFKDLKRLN